MSELKCPLCKTDSYLNPDIRIYISPCYHKICESCLNRIFSLGQAPCPECNTSLRKVNYISQTFEDIDVEKECKLRKRLNRVFYLKEHDFEDICSYNDYLEEFENTIFEMLDVWKGDDQDSQIENIINNIAEKYGEISRMNHEHDRMQVNALKRQDKDVTSLTNENGTKRMAMTIKSTDLAKNETDFDPLQDIEILPVLISKKHKIPAFYKINYIPGGFTENLLVFKAINSIFDENI